MAASLELDQGLLSKMERGVRMPGREQVYGFASFYEIDADELLVAWLFGSFARDENKPESDLDILIDVPRTVSFTLFDIAEIKNELSLATSMKADVVLERALKPGVRERVKQDLRKIYEAK